MISLTSWISEQDLSNLPSDPELAFARVELAAREHLNQAIDKSDSKAESSERHEFEYMAAVIGAAEAYGIKELEGYELPWTNDDDAIWKLRQFRHNVTRVSAKMLLRGNQRAKQYSVAFDAAAKTKLRHYLSMVRETVDKLNISQGKKDRLFRRISDLELEIDKGRTRIETFSALFIEAAANGKEVASPVLDVMERIAYTFSISKQAEPEHPQLPTHKPHKRIEPPKPTTPSVPKKSFEKDLDDEIPF